MHWPRNGSASSPTLVRGDNVKSTVYAISTALDPIGFYEPSRMTASRMTGRGDSIGGVVAPFVYCLSSIIRAFGFLAIAHLAALEVVGLLGTRQHADFAGGGIKASNDGRALLIAILVAIHNDNVHAIE